MGQFSAEIYALPGSLLSGNQHTDVALIVLAATLEGGFNTEARIEVLDGPHAGVWSVELIERDTAAAGWVGRGRRG